MRYPLLGLLSILNTAVCANAIQFFTGLNYSNPAELFKVQANEVILGMVVPNVKMKFHGTSINFNTFGYESGEATTHTTGLLPYGRFAHRLNEKIVVGVDVTEPYYSNINWGNHSVLRYVSTQNHITNFDISPRASWAINKSLTVGAGLNLLVFDKVYPNFVLPIGPTQYVNLVNQTSGNKLGFDVGAYYAFNQTNFMGLSYFSGMTWNLKGKSFLEGTSIVSPNHNAPMPLPDTFIWSYTHLFSQTWLTSWQIYYSDWTVLKTFDLNATAAGHFSFPTHYHGSAAIVGVVRHQCSDKAGLALIGVYDSNPVPTIYRSPALPSGNQYFLALSGDFQYNKNITLQVLYGHGISNPPINSFFDLPSGQSMQLTHGKVNISANAFDFRVKFTG